MNYLDVIPGSLTQTGITSQRPAYGHRFWTEVGKEVTGTATLYPFMAEFMFVRFNEAITNAGAPCFLTYDATRGLWVVATTYSAGLAQSAGGITLVSGYAQGDYGYIQVKGPNVVPMVASAAITAGLDIQHSTAADNKVKAVTAATLAEVICAFGTALKGIGGAGTIGVGEVAIKGKY